MCGSESPPTPAAFYLQSGKRLQNHQGETAEQPKERIYHSKDREARQCPFTQVILIVNKSDCLDLRYGREEADLV
ncbi:MAG: hypothetical protein K2M46_00610 [Lachnospiraceae bacterium]|nr:hypothetical protein [Lachnospiraceae bacterium]